MVTSAASTWLTTPYGAPYRLPPPPTTVVFEVYRRPLTGGWWVRTTDRGHLPLRVAVDCTRGAFLAAVGYYPGEYHLLPVDAATGNPAAVRAPGWVRVAPTPVAPSTAAVRVARRRP